MRRTIGKVLRPRPGRWFVDGGGGGFAVVERGGRSAGVYKRLAHGELCSSACGRSQTSSIDGNGGELGSDAVS